MYGNGNGGINFLVLVFAFVLAFIIVKDSDNYELFKKRCTDKQEYTIKTGERLLGVDGNITLAPRKADDPKPVFWLSNGKEEIWLRCDWCDYESPQKSTTGGSKSDKLSQKHTFGELRLEKGWGDCKLYILDLVVKPNNSITLTYCVE